MTASTAEELADDLASNFAWRRSELQVLRSTARAIRTQDRQSPANRVALRSAVVLLYAHWEGFVKESCQAYLDYVAVRRLTFNELSESFVRTAIKPMIRRAATDPAALTELAELVMGHSTTRAKLPRQGIVETGSNLRHETLGEILDALGLPSGQYAMAANLIDRELCDQRNRIAHGKENLPEPEAVEQLFEHLLDLMEGLRSSILAAAASQEYRQKRP